MEHEAHEEAKGSKKERPVFWDTISELKIRKRSRNRCRDRVREDDTVILPEADLVKSPTRKGPM